MPYTTHWANEYFIISFVLSHLFILFSLTGPLSLSLLSHWLLSLSLFSLSPATVSLSLAALPFTIPSCSSPIDSIGNLLVKLEVLILSSNNFSGKIPETLSNIRTLSRFAGYQNNFEGEICWGICQDQKINATLKRDNTIFKVIIAPTLKKFCFKVKAIHLQDTTKSPITKSKFR